jgi:hypothetical protein
MDRSLKLSEKLFCLAVNPKNGGILLNASAVLAMTLTGLAFVELMNKGLVSVENGVVHLLNPTFQDDEVHDFFMKRIKLHGRDRKLRRWISYFNVRGRKIQKHFIRSLVRKNVLRTEERRILFIPYEKVFVMDRGLVESIRKDLANMLLQNGTATDELLVLALMVEKTNLLSRILPERPQRKEARRFLKGLPETPISKAVQEAIRMMQTAVFVSTS